LAVMLCVPLERAVVRKVAVEVVEFVGWSVMGCCVSTSCPLEVFSTNWMVPVGGASRFGFDTFACRVTKLPKVVGLGLALTVTVATPGLTVTMNVCVVVMFDEFVAVQVTTDVPIGKVAPDAGEQFTGSVPSTKSLAVGVV
jgi:hypothetical protein